MTESIRELNASELELVAGGGIFGRIVTVAFGVIGAVSYSVFSTPNLIPVAAVQGWADGTLLGGDLANAAGLND
jgi:hypothetical protein